MIHLIFATRVYRYVELIEVDADNEKEAKKIANKTLKQINERNNLRERATDNGWCEISVTPMKWLGCHTNDEAPPHPTKKYSENVFVYPDYSGNGEIL